MSFYERGPVRIHYEEAGSGFPLLLIPGGGLNSTIAALRDPFDAVGEFKGEYRCIFADLRNANAGQSAGPLEIERPWDSLTDDHIGLMDHLRIDKFMVMGFCIGGPFIWNLLKRSPDRVAAAVLAQPSGFRKEMPDLFYQNNIQGWGPDLVKRRPDITMDMVEKFLTKMYRTNADFVFTVTRDFVRKCPTPVLILPDDIPAHPYAVAMEAAMLAAKAEVSMFPWKEPKERIPLAVRQYVPSWRRIGLLPFTRCVHTTVRQNRRQLCRTVVVPSESPAKPCGIPSMRSFVPRQLQMADRAPQVVLGSCATWPAVAMDPGISPGAKPSAWDSPMPTSNRSASHPCSARVSANFANFSCTDPYARWCRRGGAARLPPIPIVIARRPC